jgi:hypothetical protein
VTPVWGKARGANVNDWFDDYAAALEERLGGPNPAVHLDRGVKNPILDLARIVAHGTERKNAPLAAYVVGRYVALRSAQGADEAVAVSEALETAAGIIPSEGTAEGSGKREV